MTECTTLYVWVGFAVVNIMLAGFIVFCFAMLCECVAGILLRWFGVTEAVCDYIINRHEFKAWKRSKKGNGAA